MGNAPSFIPLLFAPPQPKWTVDDIPDMTGKVVVITGGNVGIGKETAKAVLARNAKVYLACRSPERGHPNNVAVFLELDLANLASVRKAAEDFLRGVMDCPIDLVTADNYDLQFGTNVIGHWFFSQLLLPALLAVHESTGQKARVITTSSSGAYLMRRFDYSTLIDGPSRRKMATYPLYFQSKFGNVVVARELAQRHGDKIVSISLHPGNISTELQRHQSSFTTWITGFSLFPAPLGAITQLFAGTAPEAADRNGKYLIPWARVGTPPLTAHDQEVGKRLWAWLEEQTRGR